MENYPVLKGNTLFRKDELVYINRSDELEEYCSVMHVHDFIEIACVLSGSGVHIVAGRKYETVKGDLFVINSDVPHGFFPKDGGSRPPVVYNCVFMPQFLDLSLFSRNHFEDVASSFLFKSLFPDDYTPKPDLKLSGAAFRDTGELFEKMYAEYRQMKTGYGDIIRAYLIELIIKIFRYMKEDGGMEPLPENQELVSKAIEYMKSHYNSDISLSDLAMQSFLSKNYFSRLFKKVTGTNVSDYIQLLRVGQACRLLETTGLKVTDVAMQAGFNDLKFFYEVFKKVTGRTPGDYRRTGKADSNAPGLRDGP